MWLGWNVEADVQKWLTEGSTIGGSHCRFRLHLAQAYTPAVGYLGYLEVLLLSAKICLTTID
jgi:hypothetical protein